MPHPINVETSRQDGVDDQFVRLGPEELHIVACHLVEARQNALAYRVRRREEPKAHPPLRLLPESPGGLLAGELRLEQIARDAVGLVKLLLQPRHPSPSIVKLTELSERLLTEHESRPFCISRDPQEPGGYLPILRG